MPSRMKPETGAPITPASMLPLRKIAVISARRRFGYQSVR